MNTDLIIVAAMIDDEEILRKSIKSVSGHDFNNKYILFDGPRESLFKKHYDKYTKYKSVIARDYTDFKVIENTENIYYKPMLDAFIRSNYDDLSDNLLIVQDDVEVEDFNLSEVLEQKKQVEDCKILYFREDRLRCEHWFNVIDNSGVLIKTHGWSERAWIINKKDIVEIFDKLVGVKGGKGGKFIDVYYYNLMKRGSWKDLSEDVKEEHKDIHHKHLLHHGKGRPKT